MSKKDTITVYWGPAERLPFGKRTSMLHRKPESLLSFIHGEKTPKADQQRCPALKARLDNVFVFKAAIDDEFDIDLNEVREYSDTHENYIYNTASKAGVAHVRPTNLKGYYNISYLVTWLFFASEPVIAKFTAPYYPAFTPMKGALLATGEFDIGRWLRPVALDYHVPNDENHFAVKEGDPLMFIEFMTDKKIEFKKITPDDLLHSYSAEHVRSPKMHGANKTLEERYKIADEADMPKLILSHIEKNLI